VLGVFVLRLLWLDADAASTLTWSGAPFTDEGLYSHAARNRVLFGTWRTDGWDNRLVSPLFDVLAFLVFRVAGVGYAQLRLINVVLTTLALPLWWAFLRRDVGERWAFLGVGLLGLNYFWFQYSRLGLLEPGVVVWLIASAWCWRRAVDGSWRWAIGCGICAGIAWIWKSLALVFLPVPLLALLLLQPRGGRRIAIGYVWGTVVALTIYAVAWYLPHAAELTRYNQFYAADRVPSSFTEAWRSLSNNLRSRYIIGQAPLLLGVALAGVVCAAAAIRRKNVAPMPVFCLVWLVCGAVVLIMPYSPPRYYTLLVPALVGLAVSAIRAADNHKFQPLLFLVLAALGAQTVWDGGRYVTWAHGRTTTLPDSSRALAQVVPEHTMLLGVTACGLSLENKLPCAPLIAGLANDGNPFTMLNTRYVVVENNNRDDWMRRFAPQALAEATPLQTLPLGPRRVTVYRLKDNSIEEVRMSRSIVVDSSSGKNRPR
jgi:4-amino-4-deoxy-L-arabinose transferase-like glycosyltransferase